MSRIVAPGRACVNEPTERCMLAALARRLRAKLRPVAVPPGRNPHTPAKTPAAVLPASQAFLAPDPTAFPPCGPCAGACGDWPDTGEFQMSSSRGTGSPPARAALLPAQ